MQNGPVQLVVIGFPGGELSGEIMAELERLRDKEILGLVDVLLVTKDEHGNVARADGMPGDRGAAVVSLLGLGIAGDEALRTSALTGTEAAEEEVWFATQAIPPGTSAAITLIEHRWAIPLRDAIVRAGGVTVADAWVHPEDMLLIGD
jgi:hypothetical protein